MAAYYRLFFLSKQQQKYHNINTIMILYHFNMTPLFLFKIQRKNQSKREKWHPINTIKNTIKNTIIAPY
jgi:hypothetical protein